jgi:aspartyl-tRNA synthetase
VAAPRRSVGDIGPGDFNREVLVQGWVEDVRNLGGIAFLLLRQSKGVLQVTALKKEDREVFRQLTQVPRESVVAVQGIVKENPQARHGWEVVPREVRVVAEAAAPLPLGVIDPVRAELDTRLDNRFMDLRKADVRAIFRLYALLLSGIREGMEERGFVEVATPKLLRTGAEGGATLFPVEYFGRRAYLAQSPQLYKQILMATGLDRVYEIGPAFRAELSDTVRHLAEFVSFDGEMAFVEGQEEVLAVVEGVMAAALGKVRDEGGAELTALGVEVKVPKLPVPRVTYHQALQILTRGGKEVKDGEDLDTEAEKVLGQAMAAEGHELYYVVEYPAAIKPFYIMVKDDDPGYSWSFDLEYKGDEMASGGQREHRHGRLVERIKEKGLDPNSFAPYLKAFQYGMPPHGGWGLGPQRWVWKMLDLPNIREAVLFPRDRHRLEP